MFDLCLLLSFYENQHKIHKCSCNKPIVKTYTAIVIGPNDSWGGLIPYARLIPHNVEYELCSYAKWKHIK